MVVTDLYNKMCLYFGEDTKHKILNVSISKGEMLDNTSFSFRHKDVHFTITSGMDWKIKDQILIDLHNELTTLIRKRIIDDIVK